MYETGVVLRLVDSVAEVKIERTFACGRCNLCQSREQGFMIARAANPLGAEAGDTVRMKTSSGKFVAAAALVFILPLMALIIGLGAGYILAQKQSIGKPLLHFISLICGLAFLAASYTGIHYFDKRISRKGDWRPVITGVVKRGL